MMKRIRYWLVICILAQSVYVTAQSGTSTLDIPNLFDCDTNTYITEMEICLAGDSWIMEWFKSAYQEFKNDVLRMGVMIAITIILLPFYLIYNYIKDLIKKAKKRRIYLSLLDERLYNEMPYCRDLPMNGKLFESGTVLRMLDSLQQDYFDIPIKVNFGWRNTFTAFMLRMLYKHKVKFEKSKDEHLLFSVCEPDLEVADTTEPTNDERIENSLQMLLYDAAGNDHLLQPGELTIFMEDHASTDLPLPQNLNLLLNKSVSLNEKTAKEALQVGGFLHYLVDFSKIKDRPKGETTPWKEYLVFAAFFGIADQVRGDMEIIAPDYMKTNGLTMTEDELKTLTCLCDDFVEGISYLSAIEKDELSELHTHNEEKEHW